jgi:hypothetical protein
MLFVQLFSRGSCRVKCYNIVSFRVFVYGRTVLPCPKLFLSYKRHSYNAFRKNISGLEPKRARARQHWAHRSRRLIRSVTLDARLWARRALCRRASRARLRFRALDNRAARPRARRAVADLTRLRASADTRRALGHTRLEYILAHIRLRRALRLQHILAHIRHRRARRHSRLQNPLARIRLRARRARRRRTARTEPWLVTAARPFMAPTARIICLESFRCFLSREISDQDCYHNGSN